MSLLCVFLSKEKTHNRHYYIPNSVKIDVYVLVLKKKYGNQQCYKLAGTSQKFQIQKLSFVAVYHIYFSWITFIP